MILKRVFIYKQSNKDVIMFRSKYRLHVNPERMLFRKSAIKLSSIIKPVNYCTEKKYSKKLSKKLYMFKGYDFMKSWWS